MLGFSPYTRLKMIFSYNFNKKKQTYFLVFSFPLVLKTTSKQTKNSIASIYLSPIKQFKKVTSRLCSAEHSS